MHKQIADYFRRHLPAVEFAYLRFVEQRSEALHMRQHVLTPPAIQLSKGAYIHIVNQGGAGYAATSDLTSQGIVHALQEAKKWADYSANNPLFNASRISRPHQSGTYRSPVSTPWDDVPLTEKIAYLNDTSTALKCHDKIVDWQSTLRYQHTYSTLLTSDDIEIAQEFATLAPGLHVIASNNKRTQERSGGGWGTAQQGGWEKLAGLNDLNAASRISDEALILLDAADCPQGNMDLLLMPNQMMLQIHESIGHPLELDRILGDERNYAGRSFVTLDMFGNYRYGSEHLNVSFDPSLPAELASYAFDEEGTPAEKIMLIEHGILKRPLGGVGSQYRAQLPGTANARACHWNRPPIDRMANLNIEPGEHSLDALIGAVEYGVLMDTNQSWSIDDSRNKFQFGCEYGRLIRDGQLQEVVRNPNYRGISATFWRNLAMTGDAATMQVLGTPYCGKGEPNQMIRVGHASPACLFRQVDVFGGM